MIMMPDWMTKVYDDAGTVNVKDGYCYLQRVYFFIFSLDPTFCDLSNPSLKQHRSQVSKTNVSFNMFIYNRLLFIIAIVMR